MVSNDEMARDYKDYERLSFNSPLYHFRPAMPVSVQKWTNSNVSILFSNCEMLPIKLS